MEQRVGLCYRKREKLHKLQHLQLHQQRLGYLGLHPHDLVGLLCFAGVDHSVVAEEMIQTPTKCHISEHLRFN